MKNADIYFTELEHYYCESDSAFGICSNFAALRRIIEIGYTSEQWQDPFTDGKIAHIARHRKTRQALSQLSKDHLVTLHHYFTETDPGRQIRIYAEDCAALVTAIEGKDRLLSLLARNDLEPLSAILASAKLMLASAVAAYREQRQADDRRRKDEKKQRLARPRPKTIINQTTSDQQD